MDSDIRINIMTLEQSFEKHPMVAINCMVYNHEPYLRKCLEGFVLQRTSFPIIAFVHDDCSTDGSAAIISEYAERYPDIICPMYEEENQYKFNHRTARIVEKACVESGAKYIAECEGDDYWTDPLKLQKQVDFMENHPDYSACWHDFSICNTETGCISSRKHIHKIDMIDGGCDVDIFMYLHGLYGGQPLSLLYRVSMYDFKCRDRYRYFCDVNHAILLLKAGKGRYLNFNGAVYHLHSDSSTNCIDSDVYADRTFYIISEIYQNNPDKVLLKYLKDVIMWSYKQHYIKKNMHVFWRIWRKTFLINPSLAIEVLSLLLKRKIVGTLL